MKKTNLFASLLILSTFCFLFSCQKNQTTIAASDDLNIETLGTMIGEMPILNVDLDNEILLEMVSESLNKMGDNEKSSIRIEEAYVDYFEDISYLITKTFHQLNGERHMTSLAIPILKDTHGDFYSAREVYKLYQEDQNHIASRFDAFKDEEVVSALLIAVPITHSCTTLVGAANPCNCCDFLRRPGTQVPYGCQCLFGLPGCAGNNGGCSFTITRH